MLSNFVLLSKMNPQHTIPMLVDNDVIVTDSHAICAYLSEKYGTNDNLYPKNLAARALVDSRMHFDSGFLFGRMRFLIEPVLYFNSPQFMQDRIDYIRMTWEIVEAFLEQRPFIAGDQLTIADFCCAASITSITHLVPIDENVYPKFVDWLKRMRQLPYFDEVNAEGVAMLQTALKEKLLANQKAIEDANK